MSPVLGTVTVPSSCPVGESSRTSTVASLSPAFAADTVKVLLRDLSRASSKETQLPSAANEGESDATVEVRLDSPTGQLLGTVTVPSTGDIYAYTTATARLRRRRGG